MYRLLVVWLYVNFDVSTMVNVIAATKVGDRQR